MFDRDAADLSGICGGDDSFEVHVDADHSGGITYHLGGYDRSYSEEEQRERVRLNGRHAQEAWFGFPPADDRSSGWHWMWLSGATWHDEEPYSCCPDGYTLIGEHGTEATLSAEWWSRYFNVMVHESPEESELADLSEGQIIGLGIGLCDTDGDNLGNVWRTGGPGFDLIELYGGFYMDPRLLDSSQLTDWMLLPLGDRTPVRRTSWGQIKASFGP